MAVAPVTSGPLGGRPGRLGVSGMSDGDCGGVTIGVLEPELVELDVVGSSRGWLPPARLSGAGHAGGLTEPGSGAGNKGAAGAGWLTGC